MDKSDFLMWSKKYDKAYGWQAQRERELGGRFRKNKALTQKDLASIVEWRYKGDQERLERTLALVAHNDEATITRATSQALSIPSCDDGYRVSCLMTLEGVTPVLASVILAFYDPARYCILDVNVWKRLLGNAPPNVLSSQNYLKLLEAIRKTAAKQNLDVRVIDKALYKKSIEDAKTK